MGFFRTKFSALKRNRFLKNVAVLTGGTAIAQFLPVIFLPLLGRLYDPTMNGVYTVYVSIINITQQIACFRYDYAIVVADDDEEAGGILVLSCVLATLFSILMAIVMWPLIPQIAGWLGIPEAQDSLWAIPLTTLICGTTTAVNYFNVRYEKYRTITSSVIIKAVASIAIQIGLYFLGFGYWGLILGQLLSNLFGNLRMFMTLKGRVHKHMFHPRFLWKLARKNSSYPKFMLPSGLANSLTLNLMPITISNAYTVEQTGQFGMVNRALGMPLTLVSNSVSQVFLKHAADDKENKNHLEKTFSSVAKWLLVLGLIPFGILFFFGDPIIPFILGEKWQPAATLLRYLIPLFLVRFVVTPLTSSAIALGKQKATMIWQFCLLGTVALPSLGAIVLKESFRFEWYLLLASLLMAGAYLVFYRFCYNVVKNAGNKGDKKPDSSPDLEELDAGESVLDASGQEVDSNLAGVELAEQIAEKGTKTMDQKHSARHTAKTGAKNVFWRIVHCFKTNRPFVVVFSLCIVLLIILGILAGQAIHKSIQMAAMQVSDNTEVVVFQDENLEKILQEELGKSTLTVADLEKLSSLTIENVQLSSIDELQYCVNLTQLQITGCGVVDISALGNLTRLQDLDLSSNDIYDVSALANCTQLTRLILTDNHIQDISPLYGLNELVELNLYTNVIYEISPEIRNLTNLKILNLTNNLISDITPFSGMDGLMELQLGSNHISEAAPLENMQSLTAYSLQNNDISAVESLGDLPKLDRFNIASNRLTDVEFLSAYPWIQSVNIDRNPELTSLEPLRNNTGMTAINIMDTQITDLSPLVDSNVNTIYLNVDFERSEETLGWLLEPGAFRDGDVVTKEFVIAHQYFPESSASSGEETASDTQGQAASAVSTASGN